MSWPSIAVVAVAGLVLVALGLASDVVQPVNKRLHTPAFTFLAGGVGVLGLAVGLALWDGGVAANGRWATAVHGVRAVSAHPLVTLGRNALVVYLAERVLLVTVASTEVARGRRRDRRARVARPARPGRPTDRLDIDIDALTSRLSRRRRRRHATRATASMALVLAADEIELQPTRLPEGYRRCAGPVQQGVLHTTTFCAPAGPDLQLTQGPHFALPEVGEEFPVAGRVGYLRRAGAVRELTVSDDNRVDDRHHRLTVQDADADVQQLAAVLASIPAVASAPAPANG